MRYGANEFLHEPFTSDTLSAIAGRVIRASAETGRGGVFGTVIAFLGAKAGVGASTLAVNTAGAISDSGKRTLLVDLDLQGGTVGFQLKLSKTYSVRDAIARSDSLDEDLWKALVQKKSALLDVLPAPNEWGSPAAEPDRLQGLLDYARTAYEVVIVDLPAATDYISAAALGSCDQAIVACLPDMTSVWLTRNCLAYLDGMGFARNRCSVVLNRADRKDSDLVQKVLNRSVQFVFPEDKSAVDDALMAGGYVSRNSPLGREVRRFADHMIGVQPQERRPKASFFARSLLRWT
jgi:pilus assembly protein CpaE